MKSSRTVFDYLDLRLMSCPACDGYDFELLNVNDRYLMRTKTVGCRDCGLIQVNPRPSEYGIAEFYRKDYRKYYQGTVEPSAEYLKMYNKKERFKGTVAFLKEHLSFTQQTVLLDIGCSEGAFFSVLREFNYEGQLLGVELNEEFRNFAASEGTASVYKSISEVNEKIDVVTLTHVFEHMLFPQVFLLQVANLLNTGGVIYVDVPDAEEYSSVQDLHIAHLYHYTPATLKNIFLKSGFEIISLEKHEPIAHPKSIRIIAKLSEQKLKLDMRVSAEDLQAWAKVKKISTISLRARLLARRIPMLIRVYRMLRAKK